MMQLRVTKKTLSGGLPQSLPVISPPPVISVTRSLDYEKIPKGLIYLTVMAKDGGNPPLNSTVPVTVEVIVSKTLQLAHSHKLRHALGSPALSWQTATAEAASSTDSSKP